MRGTFTNVKKSKNNMFCSISGEDGRTYFCHRNEFTEKKLWKNYCYNGNFCKFDPIEVLQEGKNPLAKNIAPALVQDPLFEEKEAYRKECKRREEAKKVKKAENLAKQEALKERKQEKKRFAEEHMVYTVGVRKKDAKTAWKVLSPVIMSDNPDDIREKCHKYSKQYPDYIFDVRKALWFKKYKVLREFKNGKCGNRLELACIG